MPQNEILISLKSIREKSILTIESQVFSSLLWPALPFEFHCNNSWIQIKIILPTASLK